MARLRGLESLRVWSRRITGAGLQHLVHSGLRRLHVYESPSIPRDAIVALREAMPGCWITS